MIIGGRRRRRRGGPVQVFGCAPGCLITSLLLSVALTIIINVLLERFGVSKMQISRLIRRAIAQLRYIADQQRLLEERACPMPLAACS